MANPSFCHHWNRNAALYLFDQHWVAHSSHSAVTANIRWHPLEHWLELKLPAPLAYLANRPHGRYRLSSQVSWSHRGDEVAAQATGGSVRYDVTYDSRKDRWYIDASWRTDNQPIASLDQLRRGPVVAVDFNPKLRRI
jgi:hypothetical protein